MTNDKEGSKSDSGVTIEEAKEVVIEQDSSSKLSSSGAILLGAFLIAGAIFFGLNNMGTNMGDAPYNLGGDTPPSTAPSGDTDSANGVDDIVPGDTPLLGDKDAPVLIVEWSDFQCPFCEKMYSQTLPEIKEKYIETGKARFAYRDFAFLGKESQDAANASRCANEQGKFWEFHDLLFESQGGENRGTFSNEGLKSLGAQLGLNVAQFDSCVDSDKYAEAVAADAAAGRAAGVSGTPTTFVNGQVVNGAQPFSAFQKIIEEELAKAGE